MSTGTYIVRRRQKTVILSARIIVPLDLRGVVGKDEIWRTLKTADKKEAQRRAGPIFAHWLTEFENLRRKRPPAEDDFQRAAYEHYLSEIDADAADRSRIAARLAKLAGEKARIREEIASGVEPHMNHLIDLAIVDKPVESDRQWRESRRACIVRDLNEGRTVNVHWAADDLIKREALDIEKGSPAYVNLCQRFQRAELEALKRADERDQGDWTGAPSDPVVKAPSTLQKAMRAKPGETIMDLFAIFKAERRAAKSDDTWNMNETIVRLFVSFIGERSHVTAITRTSIRDWKVALANWPVKAGDIKEFDGLGFKEVIRKNASLAKPKPAISDRTRNKYLSAMGSFCTWLLVNEHIPNDVTKGMLIAEKKGEIKRHTFTSEQLQTIFGSAHFTDPSINDWRRWVPLLALYSGARLGELCQLLKSDILQIEGTWIIHITKDGDKEKQLKTKGSQRIIPIHPELIRLGFLQFHARTKTERLFPELKRDTRGQFGEASRSLGRYLRKVGVKTDAGHCFYSLRHGITDAFRLAGYRDEEFKMLFGHGDGTMTARYGKLRQGEMSVLKKMIDSVTFPGLRHPNPFHDCRDPHS